MKTKRYKIVLSIAGSDSGGGAGIQADLKTFSSLGCFGTTVITAITAQNTTGVQAVEALPPSIVEAQLDSVITDFDLNAIKIGMLHSDEIVFSIHKRLSTSNIPIVLDPVMVATSGDLLLKQNGVDAIRNLLLPVVTLITPNIPEAEVLTGLKIKDKKDMEVAAQQLLKDGAKAVLLKGGHLEDSSSDLLLLPNTPAIWFESEKIPSVNTHGTGCSLSSAIASFLALGDTLEQAVRKAKNYIHNAILEGKDYKIGEGHGPIKHFYAQWD
ncbi:bifunctional hydroxymethylpyrimidine kinase/phosphomethylpyrimidine kinase [Sediminitomix flava]|uniref:hydroxymethylpyrimidine kinase n=1 Tax=Sediminitomix flava TaxID=379075 RepID=A0A315ZA83_SEDFL|nr:bifunctional hydroxymethylpyrimidine kinase/phosphomethylpyrimidine kinase [Sediminitomix flava]PWJ42079.1 hydroxymethylpyrimidine/phosphomethylpyrimidine kinase [Sediminitomix flava]